MRFLSSLLVGLSLAIAPQHVVSSESIQRAVTESILSAQSGSKVITLPLSRRHMSTQALEDENENHTVHTKSFPRTFKSMANPPLAGCPQMDFTTPVTIAGTTYNLIVDTGSSSLAVAGQNCGNCPLPQYPAASEAANVVQGAQQAQAKFGDGTGWIGTVVTDNVQLTGTNPTPVKFVAIDQQTNGFFRQGTCANPNSATFATQGIIGFAYPGLAVSATNTFFSQLVATSGISNMFSMMECYLTGQMTLGGVTPGQASGLFYYTPIIQQLWYVVELQNMMLGGQSLGLSAATFQSQNPNNAIVDSGTSLMILPPAAYNALLSALNQNQAFLNAFTTQRTPSPAMSLMQGNCLPLANGMTGQNAINFVNANLPQLNLQMGGGFTLNLSPATGYLLPFNSQTPAFCLGFANGGGTTTILGWPVVNQYVVVYDVANTRVGFATQVGCNNNAGGTITATTAVGQAAPGTSTGGNTNPTAAPTNAPTNAPTQQATQPTQAVATAAPTAAPTTSPSTIMNCSPGHFGPGCTLVYDLLGCIIQVPFATASTTGYNGNTFVKAFASSMAAAAGTTSAYVMVTQIKPAQGGTNTKVIFALFGTSVNNLITEETTLIQNFQQASTQLAQNPFGSLSVSTQAGLTLEDGSGSGATALGATGPVIGDTTTPSTTSSSMNMMPIIIGAAAGGAVLILVVLGVTIYRRRKTAVTTNTNVQQTQKNAAPGWYV